MKQYAKIALDTILYTNVYIALAAAFLTYSSFYLVQGQVSWATTGLVFFATWFIYLIHRIIGIAKIESFVHTIRVKKITTLRQLNYLFSIVSAIGIGICAFQLPTQVYPILGACAITSIFYAIPIPFFKKRLRDIHYIKIVLISITWSLVTIAIPWVLSGTVSLLACSLLCIERAVFIFAITLPFDIRDRKVDKKQSVNTISNTLGTRNTIYLSCLSLMLASALLICIAPITTSGILILTYFLIAAFITRTSEKRSDYFYTAGLDGSIFLIAIAILLGRIF